MSSNPTDKCPRQCLIRPIDLLRLTHWRIIPSTTETDAGGNSSTDEKSLKLTDDAKYQQFYEQVRVKDAEASLKPPTMRSISRFTSGTRSASNSSLWFP